MTKLFSLMSLIGLFSVLCFTHCKKKNNDNTPTAIVTATTLTGAPYGWTMTGLTADKPINPQDANPTNNWYEYLSLSKINPTFTFSTDKIYSLFPYFGYIPSSGTWSLNDANTALTFEGLTIKFTESTDSKIVGTIVYPKYGIKGDETANLTMTLTKRTQSYENEFLLANTYWQNNSGYYIEFNSRDKAAAYYDGGTYDLTYTYDKTTSKGTASSIGLSFPFSISGDKLTITINNQNVVLTKIVE